jgi:hypothetical protein
VTESRCSSVFLYLTRDLGGRTQLAAALERGPEGELWFAPDAGRISSGDLRGTQATLGGLLGAHALEGPDDLVDVAAHLVELPELESATAREPSLELRLLGLEAEALGARWPAPGGGAFEVRAAPLRLPDGRQGALLASRGAPEGPWLRALEGLEPEGRALLELLAELGLPLVSGATWLERWLGELALEPGPPTPAEVPALVDGLRALLRGVLRGGNPGPQAVAGAELAVCAEPAGAQLRWRFELSWADTERAREVITARFAAEAVAELEAVAEAPHQPFWLLFFDRRGELGSTLVGVVELRRYLGENLHLLEDGRP